MKKPVIAMSERSYVLEKDLVAGKPEIETMSDSKNILLCKLSFEKTQTTTSSSRIATLWHGCRVLRR